MKNKPLKNLLVPKQMNRLYMSPKRLETFFSCSGLMIKTEVIIFENRMFLTTYNTPLKIHQIIIPILRFLSHHIAFKPLTFWRLSTPLDITKLALEKKVMWKRSVKCFRFLQHLIISPFFLSLSKQHGWCLLPPTGFAPLEFKLISPSASLFVQSINVPSQGMFNDTPAWKIYQLWVLDKGK